MTPQVMTYDWLGQVLYIMAGSGGMLNIYKLTTYRDINIVDILNINQIAGTSDLKMTFNPFTG